MEQLTLSQYVGFKVLVEYAVVQILRMDLRLDLVSGSERKLEGRMAQTHGPTAGDCRDWLQEAAVADPREYGQELMPRSPHSEATVSSW